MISTKWTKSTYSQGGATNCVECRWTKSSYSQDRGNCVECRTTESRVHIRDTQHRDHGHLAIPTREWAALLGALRRDEV
jgi:hypothetical protein